MKRETMTAKERLEAAINLQEPDRVPICPMVMFSAAPHAGITYAEFITNPNAAIEAQHKIFDDLGGWDAMMLGGAIDPLPFAFIMPLRLKLPGKELPADSIWQFDEAEMMTVDDYDIIISKGWDEYMWKHLLPRIRPGVSGNFLGKLGVIFKLIGLSRGMKKEICYYEERGVPTLVGGMMSLPFDMFSVARSMSQFTLDLYRRPEKVIAAMDAALPGMIKTALQGVKDTGIRRVFIGGSRGAGAFISPQQFERFFLPWLKKTAETFAANDIITLLHFDQDWTLNLPYFKELPKGKCILEVDGMTDIFKAKEVLGGHMCLMGDVPATLFKLGTPQRVEAYCKKLIDVVGKGGGFILSSGCEVPHDAKFENIQAMIQTGKTYYPHYD